MKQHHSIVRKETANHFKHNAFLHADHSLLCNTFEAQTPKDVGRTIDEHWGPTRKKAEKILEMAIAIVLWFAVCWLPLNILGFFGKDLGSEQLVVLQSSLI